MHRSRSRLPCPVNHIDVSSPHRGACGESQALTPVDDIVSLPPVTPANVSNLFDIKHHGAPLEEVWPPRESMLVPPDAAHFDILHINIRGWLSHSAELEARIHLLPTLPTIICINETKLDVSVADIHISGYTLVSRRDRGDCNHGGGVAVFVLDSFSAHVTFLEDSTVAERSWHLIHSSSGPILFAAWYRRPNPGEIESIQSFIEEWSRLSHTAFGTILVGDLNLHHTHWLRFSSGVSREGSEMYKFCRDNGFLQHVRGPTHGNGHSEIGGHLLDLVLSDFDCPVSIRILPEINIHDHNLILASFSLDLPVSEPPTKREVWTFLRADWVGLRSYLAATDWSWVDGMDPNEATTSLTTFVLQAARKFIPTHTFSDKKSSHPWINERCAGLISAKLAAHGTSSYKEAVLARSAGIMEEFCKYTGRTRDELRKLRRGSFFFTPKRLDINCAHSKRPVRHGPLLN